MELQLQIKMNKKLFLRDPELTGLGKKIIQQSIILIHKTGFEAFTFKKLAEEINSTEAGVYRYFENKHKLLMYITAWYWSWLEYRISISTLNIADPVVKLKKTIRLLATTVEDDINTSHINEYVLHQIIISEGSKAYLTKHVSEDNKDQFFKPYKNLCARVGEIIQACNPAYKYPRSLSSTIIEMAHFQNFFMQNLPALTDFGKEKNESKIINYLEELVFSAINYQY
jgi:AcrR family transcriptional regulator